MDENFSKNYGYYPSMNNNDTIGLVHDPERFYHDFYNFLNKSNIDFVKVDNQGSFQDLGMSDKISVWDKYRQAVTKQADTFFHGQVIHSMALTPHILFHSILSQNSIFRNSDDFFPNENDSHAWHIYANAINSLWTFNLVGDWDMFQSDHLFAEYHASRYNNHIFLHVILTLFLVEPFLEVLFISLMNQISIALHFYTDLSDKQDIMVIQF